MEAPGAFSNFSIPKFPLENPIQTPKTQQTPQNKLHKSIFDKTIKTILNRSFSGRLVSKLNANFYRLQFSEDLICFNFLDFHYGLEGVFLNCVEGSFMVSFQSMWILK
jgi:hypothetical protein